MPLADQDKAWITKLRYRLEDFRATAIFSTGLACSIKLRPTQGRFDRTNAPLAYALIDARLRGRLSSKIWLGEHDTGPELLCAYVVSQTPDFRANIPSQIPELLSEIVSAASAGRYGGDPIDTHLDLLIRGVDEAGLYFERVVMCIELTEPTDASAIQKHFESAGIQMRHSKQHKA